MKTLEQKKQEFLSIKDPRQAYIKIATGRELSLTDMEQIIEAYQQHYGLEIEDMAFYPDGERVLKAEMFWGNTEK